MRHPFSCTWLLVIADECLALQNTDSLQCAASWRLVSRALYGGHFISGTMFRKHYSDLLDMLKMLRSSIPLRAEFVQAYFAAYLISYVRPQRSWSTELVPLSIPASVQASYSEVLDECRGRGAQNFVKVLARMRCLLSTSLQQDALPLSQAVWTTVQKLRAEGRRPLVFASTEREAEALVRHIACARRFRRSHPKHCKGCDLCRNFNKHLSSTLQIRSPSGSESQEELLIFTVGADSAGLNLQSLGDALVLRSGHMKRQSRGRFEDIRTAYLDYPEFSSGVQGGLSLKPPKMPDNQFPQLTPYKRLDAERLLEFYRTKALGIWKEELQRASGAEKPLAMTYERCFPSLVDDLCSAGAGLMPEDDGKLHPLSLATASELVELAVMAPLMFSDLTAGSCAKQGFCYQCLDGKGRGAIFSSGLHDEKVGLLWRGFDKRTGYTRPAFQAFLALPQLCGALCQKWPGFTMEAFKEAVVASCAFGSIHQKEFEFRLLVIYLGAEEGGFEGLDCVFVNDLLAALEVRSAASPQSLLHAALIHVGYLVQNDDRFRHVVQLIGPPTAILELLGKGRPDPFTTLVQTVCHQQLSVKVCQGMFQRLLSLCGNRDSKILHPEQVLQESPDKIREVAKLSYRKIQYIQGIAQRFLDGTLNSEIFDQASDQEVRERMMQLPGIGEWTLEMFLIFQLHRHGGIPFGDVAIQSAMKLIYNIAPPAELTTKNEVSWMPSKAQMEPFAMRWGPFGSIASLYLLRVADNVNAIFLPLGTTRIRALSPRVRLNQRGRSKARLVPLS
ncbi:unnamed protein product [Durusdinium trenchii]|uniref:HhH-GPD domain-containing protein n=1 Tax=Durusdinium trenchii TaxID=1381693 RepID=A0ABP0SRR5_9DINO